VTWSRKWSLSISHKKTECLLFTNWSKEARSGCQLNLQHNAYVNIKLVPFLKFLGVTFDELLIFRQHVDDVHAKVLLRQRAITILGATDFGANEHTVRLSHKCITEPVLDYGSAIYSIHAAPSTIEKLEALQRAAGRAITGLPRFTNNAVGCVCKVSADSEHSTGQE
jgi:hypothetical protein